MATSPMTARKPVVGVAIVVGVLFASASAASASTVSVDAGTLAYAAGQGEINQVRIERVAAFFRVRDDTATLTTTDPDCTAINEHLARCLAAPVSAIEALGRDQPDAIIVGGAKPTTISGGDGTDTLQSDQGDDTLSAGSSGPVQVFGESLSAGEGDDVLHGSTNTNGSGTTFMQGGPGEDTLIGGPGFDAMVGGAAADVFRGGGGNSDQASYSDSPVGVSVTINDVANDGAPGENDDVRTDVESVSGSPFPDVINGSSANNSLSGLSGADTLRGLEGGDFLDGGEDGDTLTAGDGNDIMRGGFGTPAADTYFGGPDIDQVVYDDRPNADPLSITIDNVADDGSTGENDNIRTDVENVDGGPGPDTITGSNEDNVLQGRDGDDTIVGAGGDDTLRGDIGFGSFGDDDLNGGGGDDLLFGGLGGNDDFRGSAGFDTVSYSELSTGTGTDVTINDIANDGPAGENDNVRTDVESVFGGSGVDDITGSPGPDVLLGFAGTDTLDGAGGDDLLDGEGPQFFTPEGDVLIGGTGVDAVSYASHFNPVTADIDDIADDGILGENDRVRTSVENLFGGSSNDTLTGSADANIVDGGQGSSTDVVNGLGGPDFLSGGPAFDTYNGASGNDHIHSRDGAADAVDCGPNTDSVEADAADTLANCENVFNPRPLVAPRPTSGGALKRVWKASKRRLALATEAAERIR
jgi:Ca2+-binding RTX toxin-like protein